MRGGRFAFVVGGVSAVLRSAVIRHRQALLRSRIGQAEQISESAACRGQTQPAGDLPRPICRGDAHPQRVRPSGVAARRFARLGLIGALRHRRQGRAGVPRTDDTPSLSQLMVQSLLEERFKLRLASRDARASGVRTRRRACGRTAGTAAESVRRSTVLALRRARGAHGSSAAIAVPGARRAMRHADDMDGHDGWWQHHDAGSRGNTVGICRPPGGRSHRPDRRLRHRSHLFDESSPLTRRARPSSRPFRSSSV